MNILNSRAATVQCNSLSRLIQPLLVYAAGLLLASALLMAQTVGTGSIVGVVTDPQGAVMPGAKVGITNKATAALIHVTTSSAGSYTSGPIVPGDYTIRIEAKGFKTIERAVVVQVGNTVSDNVKMQIGQ